MHLNEFKNWQVIVISVIQFHIIAIQLKKELAEACWFGGMPTRPDL